LIPVALFLAVAAGVAGWMNRYRECLDAQRRTRRVWPANSRIHWREDKVDDEAPGRGTGCGDSIGKRWATRDDLSPHDVLAART